MPVQAISGVILMSSKSKLFYGAAAMLAIAGVAGVANAQTTTTKAVKKHHAVAAESATSAQVKALTEEVNALKAELDQEVAARQQVQAQSQAQAQADQAQAAAVATQSHVDDEIKRIPGEVKDDVATAVPPKAPSWTDNTTVGGVIFGDFSDITSKVNGVKSNASTTLSIPGANVPSVATSSSSPAANSNPNGYGTDIKRFYISVDHKFNDIFSTDITTDALYNTSTGTTALFIKKAYINANFSPAFDVSLGDNNDPWIPYVENIYGYRFVENTLTDRLSFAKSADWGVHANGTFAKFFAYDVAAINGNGYKNPTRSNTVDWEGRLSAKVDQWNLAVGGYTGKLGQEAVVGTTTPQTASRFDALAAFVGDRTRLGIEYFSANDYSASLVTKTTPDKADGYSIFGSYRIDPVWSVFARDDTAKLSKIITPAKKDDYSNFGIDYSAIKNLDIALTFKQEKYEASPTSTVKANEIGIFTQVKY